MSVAFKKLEVSKRGYNRFRGKRVSGYGKVLCSEQKEWPEIDKSVTRIYGSFTLVKWVVRFLNRTHYICLQIAIICTNCNQNTPRIRNWFRPFEISYTYINRRDAGAVGKGIYEF